MAAKNSADSRNQHTRLLDLPDSLLTCLVEAVSLKNPKSYKHGLVCRKLSDISPSAQSAVEVINFCPQFLSELKAFPNLTRLSTEGDDFEASQAFEGLFAAAPSWNRLQAFEAYDLSNFGFISEELLTAFFEGCRGLRSLKLSWCRDDIPSSISLLVYLETLFLCGVRSLPDNVGDLKRLRSLELYSSAKVLPTSLTGLFALEELKLEIVNVTHLPEAIGALRRLTYLYIESVGMESLPKSIKALTKLRKLRLPGCFSLLVSLPYQVQYISSLRKLEIPTLWDLELLRNLPRLSSLRFHPPHPGNEDVEEIPDTIGELWRLKSLKLRDLPKLRCLPQQLSALQHLTKLHVSECPGVKQVDIITNLFSLKKLHISDCASLEALPLDILQGCAALQELSLFALPRLTRLPEVIRQSNRLKISISAVAAVEADLR